MENNFIFSSVNFIQKFDGYFDKLQNFLKILPLVILLL